MTDRRASPVMSTCRTCLHDAGIARIGMIPSLNRSRTARDRDLDQDDRGPSPFERTGIGYRRSDGMRATTRAAGFEARTARYLRPHMHRNLSGCRPCQATARTIGAVPRPAARTVHDRERRIRRSPCCAGKSRPTARCTVRLSPASAATTARSSGSACRSGPVTAVGSGQHLLEPGVDRFGTCTKPTR